MRIYIDLFSINIRILDRRMKKVLILNPKSNKKKRIRLIQDIQATFCDDEVIVEESIQPGDTVRIAKKYAQMNENVHVFACGGDGTIHEVVNGIVGCKNVMVTPIPIGRGNDFVKSLDDYTQEDLLNISLYKNPVQMECDVIQVNQHYAINTVSFGFDVEVAQNVNRFRSILKGNGTAPYFIGMLKALFHMKGQYFDFCIDKTQGFNQEFLFVVFCNGKYYGGGYQPCPKAKLDDGWIDVCLINPIKRRKLLQLSKAYEQGLHINFPELAILSKAKEVQIDTKGKEISVNLDGEIYSVFNPTIRIIEKGVCFALPNKGV